MGGQGDNSIWPGSDNPRGALAGVRVVDLSRVLAGPLCTQMLSDHGAQVIKVEPPTGDETRVLGPPFAADGQAAYFAALNRGKRSIALDLSQPQEREVLLGLLEEADVLVENFLPGTMKKWGLDFEGELIQRFPRLIYCDISGFGEDGPLGGLPGYDAVLQAMCGVMSVNGDGTSGPTRVGIPIVDHLTGYTSLVGVLMALLVRQQTGRGQRVSASLFDTALTLLLPHATNYFCSGKTPGLLGSAHPNISPYDKYETKDGFIFLGVVNDVQFKRFCKVIERTDLLDNPLYGDNPRRIQHRTELKAEIEATLRMHSKQILCEKLMRAGVAAGAVNTVAEALAQPHASHRQMTVERPGYRGLAPSVRLSENRPAPGALPPAFDEHGPSIRAALKKNTRKIE